MNKKILGVVLILPLMLNACATASGSLLLGAAIGGSAGGAIGQSDSGNAAIGALIGASIGSLIGYAAYSDKQKKETIVKPKTEEALDLTPSLTKPRVRSYMVPDSIEGNKYIKSHRVFILEDPGSWSKD